MKTSIRCATLSLLAITSAWSFAGCSDHHAAPKGDPSGSASDSHTGHEHGDHKEHANSHEGHKADAHEGGDHHAGPLTEKDVKLPDSFAAGTTRVQELHEQIEHLIEHGELAKVHRVAEEMALVAKKMKELARKDLAEDKQAEAGRFCNELAGYYSPIDEAADAGKKAQTETIHKQMAATIEKLAALAK